MPLSPKYHQFLTNRESNFQLLYFPFQRNVTYYQYCRISFLHETSPHATFSLVPPLSHNSKKQFAIPFILHFSAMLLMTNIIVNFSGIKTCLIQLPPKYQQFLKNRESNFQLFYFPFQLKITEYQYCSKSFGDKSLLHASFAFSIVVARLRLRGFAFSERATYVKFQVQKNLSARCQNIILHLSQIQHSLSCVYLSALPAIIKQTRNSNSIVKQVDLPKCVPIHAFTFERPSIDRNYFRFSSVTKLFHWTRGHIASHFEFLLNSAVLTDLTKKTANFL